MPTRSVLARVAALGAAATALAGCAPGTLATTPTSSAPPSTTTTEPTPEAEPERSLLLTTLAASNALAVVDPDAAEPVVASVEVGAAP